MTGQAWNKSEIPAKSSRVAIRDGFTIPELLAVIAVLLILGAILFAVIGNVRDRVRTVETVSNLRQVTQGYLLLIQEGGGETAVFRGGIGGGNNHWSLQLADMGVGDRRGAARKVFYPVEKAEAGMEQSAWTWFTFGLRTYGSNATVEDVETDDSDYQMLRVNYRAVGDPANYLLFGNTVWPARSDFSSGELLGSFRHSSTGASNFDSLHVPEYADGVPIATLDGAVTVAGRKRLKGFGIRSVLVGSNDTPVRVENLSSD